MFFFFVFNEIDIWINNKYVNYSIFSFFITIFSSSFTIIFWSIFFLIIIAIVFDLIFFFDFFDFFRNFYFAKTYWNDRLHYRENFDFVFCFRENYQFKISIFDLN